MKLQVGLLLASFVVSVFFGKLILHFLKKIHVEQHIRDDGPETHLKKEGTPSMGGLIFLASITFMTFLAAVRYTTARESLIVLLVTTLLYGGIGFIDDYIKVVKKRSTGLYAWQKVLLLLVVSGLFVYYIVEVMGLGTETYIPIVKKFFDLGYYVFIPFAILVMMSTTNVVNITDGLDGLATGIVVIIMAFFTMLGIAMDSIEIIIFSSIVTGSCLGFLVYNVNPAKVFMGDTGSLALGGAIGAVSLMVQMPILLIVVAGVCVAEALSDIIQVIYFKASGGKRIFKMAPLHHHFELCGWSEKKIVWTFWGLTIVLCAIGFLLV
ncbi:MAG: phospho-N-acetylmuramoyl-pentapeptide-transferase [Clostridia bacterium]|nr:phospho-N-acetylmuramoyl-pentapeptide-transferase [Clostridia bacterium]